MTADFIAATLALGVASGLALWGVWLGYYERRKRLILERALAKAAEDHAHKAAMDAFASADRAVTEADRKAAKDVARETSDSSLAEYLRKQSGGK